MRLPTGADLLTLRAAHCTSRQTFDVAEIFRAPGRLRLSNERVLPDEVNREIAERSRLTAREGFVEGEPGELREDIDAPPWQTHLKLDARSLTVVGVTPQTGLNTVDLVRPRSDRHARAALERAADAALRNRPIRALSLEDLSPV